MSQIIRGVQGECAKFFRGHQFVIILSQVFENSGVKVITDLPIIRSCQLLTDAINAPEFPYEPSYHSDGGNISVTLAIAVTTVSNAATFDRDKGENDFNVENIRLFGI